MYPWYTNFFNIYCKNKIVLYYLELKYAVGKEQGDADHFFFRSGGSWTRLRYEHFRVRLFRMNYYEKWKWWKLESEGKEKKNEEKVTFLHIWLVRVNILLGNSKKVSFVLDRRKVTSNWKSIVKNVSNEGTTGEDYFFLCLWKNK